jgi:hypothetical protein
MPNQCHIILLRVAPPPLCLISSSADSWSSSSMTPEVEETRPLSRALLRPSPPLKGPLGEFPSLRHIRRDKSHKKQCPIARATPSSGEPHRGQGVLPPAVLPPHLPRLTQPCLDQRPRLDPLDTPLFD